MLLREEDRWCPRDEADIGLGRQHQLPLFEASLSGLSATATVPRPTEVSMQVSVSALANVFNVRKQGWEPVLEPMRLEVREPVLG